MTLCGNAACGCSITGTAVEGGSGQPGNPWIVNTGAPQVVTSLTRPTSPNLGDEIWETDTSRLYLFDGVNWVWQSGHAPQFFMRNAEGTVLSGTPHDVEWTIVESDSDGFTAPMPAAEVTVPAGLGGIYQFDWVVRYEASGSSFRRVRLQVTSGTRHPPVALWSTSGYSLIATGNMAANGSATASLNAAATLHIDTAQVSGGDLDLEPGGSYFTGRLVEHHPEWT